MLSVLLLSMAAYAECPPGVWCEDTGGTPPEPEPCPVGVVCIDDCPMQAIGSDDFVSVQWITNRYHDWQTNGPNFSTVLQPDGDPATKMFQPNSASGTTNVHELTCSLTTDGEINCYGLPDQYGQITGHPTGTGYTDLAVGNNSGTYNNRQAWAALTSTGAITVWGYTALFGFSTPPTATGFDDVAVGYGPVGCAVDSAVPGVSCWGADVKQLVSNAPTTGYYTAVALGAQVGGAVTTTGELVMWGDPAVISSFTSVWPGYTDVVDVSFNESGTGLGTVWHEDGTITVWQSSTAVGQAKAISNGPCVSNCPAVTADIFESDVSFRTMPWMNKGSMVTSICGVVANDPDGVYNCGDVICWGKFAESSGIPAIKATCGDITYCE